MSDAQADRLFHQLVWPHRAAVLRVAQILTGNVAEAEDLAQDTLLKAYKAMASFREGSDIKAWLMAILRNSRIDRLRASRSAARNVSLDELDLDPPDRSTSESGWDSLGDLLNTFSDQQVIHALQDLPEEIRWTLLLVDVEGWDQKSAAQTLEIPVGTVKSRVHRGRAMLRRALLPVARQMRLVRE